MTLTISMFAAAFVAPLWMAIAQPLDPIQHTALMDFYNGLGCSVTICPRFALSSNCTGPMIDLRCVRGNVLRLDLINKQLSGTISSSIGLFTALARLSLRGNRLSGPITSYIGQLTTVVTLDLTDNQLTGAIPTYLGQMTALTYLELTRNQLSGILPTTIAQMTALTYLSLSDNELTGAFPTYIGQLSALVHLSFARNQLTGTISTGIGQLSTLSSLFLFDNQLTGTIPPLSSSVINCNVQSGVDDANCLDCSTASSICMFDCVPRTCLPLSGPRSPTQEPRSSTTTTTSRLSLPVNQTTTQTNTIFAGETGETTSAELNTTTAFAVGSTTIVAPKPATQTSDDTVTTGGIVGGVVALLVCISGVIACIVMRNRRKKNKSGEQSSHQKSTQKAPASVTNDNYGNIGAVHSQYTTFATKDTGYEMGDINIRSIESDASDANYEKSNIEV